MFNTLIRITYDGTCYSGFQFQENALTIQEVLERALGVIYKQPLRINGAGRTDAGVHARGQAATFRAPFRVEAEKLPHALNCLLPSDIVVTGAVEVSENFHARFQAGRKIYSYTLDRAPFPQVTKRLYSLHHPGDLNLEIMRDAAKQFTGKHDFKAFRAAGSPVSDTTRTLYSVKLKEVAEEQLVIIYFEGSGFLYRMARILTGSLLRAGTGTLSPEQIKATLEGQYPGGAGPTAPAHGLCLEKVIYSLLPGF